MAEFGEEDLLLKNTDDRDDDDDEDTTRHFQPDDRSTPGTSGEEIAMTTMNRDKEKGTETAETSFIEGDTYSRVLTADGKAWDALTDIYPEAKASDINVNYSKSGRSQVKMFGQGKKFYDLYTIERGTKKQRLNPALPKQIKNALGPEREVLIAQKDKDIEELQESIREDEIILDD